MKFFFQKVLTKIYKLSRPESGQKDGLERKLPKKGKDGQKTESGQKASEREGRTYHRRVPRKKGRRRRRPSDVPATPADSVLQESWSVSQFKVPPVEGKTRFHDFELPDPLFHAISDLGYEYCTPIQSEILPSTLSGKDASGRAQTGTGKTAAFLITIITRMLRNPINGKRRSGTPRILIIAPTRELVLQIAEEARQLAKYTDLKIVPVFGGMDYEKQKRQLSGDPVDIIVATPGRLLDFQRRQDLFLKRVEVLIIDEADRMLDMGFIPDVRKIIYNTPAKDKRQTLLFSATLTEEITRLASQWTRQPVTVEIEPEQVAVDTVEQVVYIVTASEKFALLVNIITREDLHRVLVFCNRRDEVRWLAGRLARYGINCSELTGDVPQKKRGRRLEDFKSGKIRVLVATDVAGRGIHIEGMDHVINFTLPHDPEDYVHRIGRTGRAGASGTSVSFADETDSFYIPVIEEFMDRKLHCTAPDEEWLAMLERPKTKQRRRPHPKRKRRSRSRRKTTDSPSG
ncbi:MAG: ATP-dependent RNA helicase RhlB [Deltaproteobacteria bacterium]|nr:ATP-dependent RNA helicase RhlB [Deltaproteobacteria bacterium]